MRGTSVGIYSTTNIPSYPEFEPVFDGTFFLENSDPSGLPSGNTYKSIFAWVKVPIPTTAQAFFAYGSDDAAEQTELSYNNNHREYNFYWNQYFSPITEYGDSSFILAPNTWYFIGITYDSFINMHVFVNGKYSTRALGTGGISSGTDKIRVGLGIYNLNSTENIYVGNIEKVGVWERALTTDEIHSYYEAGRVNYEYLPSELKTTISTEVNNAQARLLNLSNFQSRQVLIDSLQAKLSEAYHQSASFDGSSKITITAAPSNIKSISFWVNLSGSTNFGPLIVKGDATWASTSWDWGIFADSDNFYAVAEAGYSPYTIPHNDDTWYHIVLVRNNENDGSDFYINGSLVGTSTSSDANVYDDIISIGGIETAFITGKISEIQLFSVALSTEDISNLYNSGNGVYGSPSDLWLVAGYHLNGDTTNYSSYGNSGLWDGTQAYVTGPILNTGYKAASFDGTNQLLITPVPSVNSVSLWVCQTGETSNGAIITKGTELWNSGVWDWGIWHDGGTTFYASATAGGPFASFNYNYDTWYHLVLVRDNGTGSSEFYVNGNLIGTGTASSSNAFDDYIIIGGTVNYFLGKIEEIQLFDIALSPEDITELYNSGNGVYGSNIDAGLVGGYHLNGDPTDYSVTGNHAYWNNSYAYTTGVISASTLSEITTSNSFQLQALTEISIEDVYTSSASIIEFSIPTVVNILTSTGDILEFGSATTVNNGVVNFWNLTESSGTRYDSVGTNHLNQIDVVASFDYETPVGIGNSVSFTDTTVLPPSSWLWDFGDGSEPNTSQNPTHIYNSLGTFTVTLTVDDFLIVSHDIVVEMPVASFTTNSPQDFGNAISFTDASTYALSWLWDFGDDNTSTLQNPNHTYANAGTYNVKLEINGNVSNTNVDVVVNEVESFIWDKVNLSDYYNIVGFVTPGFNYNSLPNYGLDGMSDFEVWGTGGYSMNAAALGDSPQTFFGVEFDTPVASPENNVFNVIRCTGQVIPLHGGQYTELRLLGFITNAVGRNVSFIITYSDESTDTINQSMSDWFYNTSNNYANERTAVAMSSRISSTGNISSSSIFLHEYYLPLDYTKNAVSITLPSSNEFTFICSITQTSQIVQPLAWIKADSLNADDGDLVANWHDINNIHNFLQANTVNQPIFKTNILNGHPAVKFDGSNDYMQSTINVPNKYSVIAVYKQLVTGTFSIAISWGSGNTGKTFWSGYILGTANTGHLIPASDSHIDNVSDSIDDTDWHVIDGVFDGMHLIGRDFGVLATPILDETSAALSSSTATIGAYGASPSLFWNGYIAEALFFNTDLSDTVRGLIQSYLQYKYRLVNQNEIQTISFNTEPTEGSFDLVINGQTVSNIPYDATAEDIEGMINTALGDNVTHVS